MDEAVSTTSVRNDIWQLALGRKITGDVMVITSHTLQVMALRLVRIKYNHCLLEYMSYSLNGAHLICIASYNNKAICFAKRGIRHERSGQIHIRSLLLELLNRN